MEKFTFYDVRFVLYGLAGAILGGLLLLCAVGLVPWEQLFHPVAWTVALVLLLAGQVIRMVQLFRAKEPIWFNLGLSIAILMGMFPQLFP